MSVERVHQFGAQQRLLGIVTPGTGPSPIGCVLMNVGVIHRIGPHRINVKLARALAQGGVTTMRLDLSGLGDSRLGTGSANYIDQAITDLGEAFDLLAREHRLERFLLVGMCSGAVNACAAALADSRVAGVVLFDGYAFPTWKTPIARMRMNWNSTPWQALLPAALRSLRRRLRRRPSREAKPAPTTDADNGTRVLDRHEFGAALATLCARGTRVCLLLSGSIPYYYTYAEQMRDTYGREPWFSQIRVEFMPDVDHTVTPLHAQRRFIDAVVGWAAGVVQTAGSRTPPTV